MRNPDSRLLFPILAALILFTTACETADQRHARIAPPPHATAPAVALPTPAAEAPPVPKIDPAQATLASAEREYQAGEENYKAGHLEAARQNFDSASKALLEAPVEMKSDPRLQAESEKIAEASHQLEQSLKEGEDSEQKAEPAPIDETNEVTFPVDPNVKAQGEAELKEIHSDLPLVMNDYVAGYLNFFATRGHGTVERALTRAGRYREMIERIFKEEGVPQDLIYLAQAESGFEPLALSRAGARGMWQFIASRANAYGLERNWWIDERQDPEKSTRAAARHLKDLHKEFGDWYLAMAAYNSGPVNVQQAVRRTGFADFWELYKRNVLPKETKNYVPIILAMAIVAKNPAQYGLADIQPDLALQVDSVTIDYPVDLRLVAQCIDSSAGVLQQLNPSLLRMSTPKQGNFILNLPPGTAAKFQEAISAIPVDKRVWWRYHKVAEGETLASIARQYKTTTRAITEVNGLEASEVAPETNLIIPIAAGKHAPGEAESAVFSRHATRYRVRSGDTVLSVADDFNVPPEKLRRWNHMKGNLLRKGRVLLVYRPLRVGESQPALHKYRKKSNLRAATPARVATAKAKKPKRRASHPPSAATLAGAAATARQR